MNNPRVDLLARNALGELRHVEFETRNRPDTPRRYAEYYLGFHRLYDHVEQVLLFASREPLSMPPYFKTKSMRHDFRILEVKDMDGDMLVESADWGDNILAMLTEADQQRVLDRVELQLRKLDGEPRNVAAMSFVAVSGIIGVEETVLRRRNLIELDLMDNKILAPMFKQKMEQGLEQGLELGLQKGLQQGREEGGLAALRSMLLRILEKRFGQLPSSVPLIVNHASRNDLGSALDRALDAKTIGEVFGL